MQVENALRLDRVLAAASDTWEESTRTLRDELTQIDKSCEILREKAGYISGKDPRLSAQPLIAILESMVECYGEQAGYQHPIGYNPRTKVVRLAATHTPSRNAREPHKTGPRKSARRAVEQP